jgi:two-component system, NarL family, sensor histidine kinase EvgS
MALWSQRTGLRFEFQRLGTNAEVLDALRRGDIDMTPFTVPLESRRSFAAFTRPAYVSNLVLAARRDVPDISPTADFGGRRVAVESGSSVEGVLAEQYPHAQIERFDNAEAALRAVAQGQADLFVGYQHVAVYEIERLLLANIELRRSLGPGSVPLGPAVRLDQPQLRSILDKAIASISASDRFQLAQRWLPAASLNVPLPSETPRLSDAEVQWIHDKGRIRVGYDASFSPITMQGPLGEFKGFGADMFRLVADKAGLTVELEAGASFADVYEAGKRGRLDVVVGMARTARRREDFDFVGPFMTLPTVLFTRADEPAQVAETRDIGNRKLALLKGHFLIPELRARHPGIVLVELERQDQVMAAVAEGAADVGLGNLSVVNELIEQRFTGRIMVSGIVKDGDSELYFAVSRRLPELTRVLSRAFEAVNDSETAALRARWLARDVHSGLSWRQVLQVAVPAGLILLSYVFLLGRGNRRLRAAREKEREAREVAEGSTAARSRFLAYLSHELRGTLSAIASAAGMLKRSDDPALRSRMLDAVAQSSTGLLKMVESTLRHEQSLHAQLQLDPTVTDLSSWWEETLAPARIAAQSKGLGFDARWTTLPGTGRIDAVRLQQVVQNLLNNAVKFTPQGSVTVRAACVPGSPDGLVPTQLRFEIRDTGPGLAEADHNALFEAYSQGEQGRLARDGAGLGLAISAQIVKAMGGRLEAVAQAPGHGAQFVLQVPVILEAVAGDTESEAEAESGRDSVLH